jgi:hypothetical protein
MTAGNSKMNRVLRWLTLLACLAPAAAFSNSTSNDATSLDEAYGQINQRRISSEVFHARCVSEFPELKGQIEADIAKWKRHDAVVLRKAAARTAYLRTRFPDQFAAMDSASEANTREMISGIMASGKETARNVCKVHFANLGNGYWRKQTPNVYKLIEAAPR